MVTPTRKRTRTTGCGISSIENSCSTIMLNALAVVSFLKSTVVAESLSLTNLNRVEEYRISLVCVTGWQSTWKTWKSCGISHWSGKSQGN